jgi:hypothetical protein
MRPSTSMGNMHAQGGRGSNPMGRNQAVSAGWESQIPPNYREPLSPNRPPTLPQVDIASANFDQGGNRRQNPLPLNVNRPYSHASQPPSSPGYGPDPSQRPLLQQGYNNSIPRRDPAANSFQRPERGSSMMPVASLVNPAVNQRPERFDSMTPVSGPSRASQRMTQTMSSTMSSQQGPDSRSSSAAGSVASLPPKRPGPATFEEMGIPAGKNDSDCVSVITILTSD